MTVTAGSWARSSHLRRRVTAWGVALGLAVIVTVSATGCSFDESGDRESSGLVDQTVERLADAMSPPYASPREADYLVATHIPQLSYDDGEGNSTRVDALDWSGSSGEEPGARITVRIHSEVSARGPLSMFGPSRTAGNATKCFDITIVSFRYYDTNAIDEVDCPDPAAPVPAIPVPDPLPALPGNSPDRLTSAMQAATPDTLQRDVEAAFDGPGIVVRTQVADGRTVAAVGVPTELQCIVGELTPDGSVTISQGFDRTTLQPGEQGCSPGLVGVPTP